MDTGTCAGKRGLMKCRGDLLPYEHNSGDVRQAFCTKCFVEWNISVFGDGCVKFEKRAPFRLSMPQTRRLVRSSEDLHRGDHVIWGRGSDTRHGLVVKILGPNEARVFSLDPEGKGKIEKVNLDLSKSATVLVCYSEPELSKVHNPTDQVILRARSHAKRRGTFSSGEQFVVFCKTGSVKRFEMAGQFVRELYEEVRVYRPTSDSLELASNVSILIFNILLGIFIESWVECAKCVNRETTPCGSRRYWFLSLILLVALEGLVFLFYVIWELHVEKSHKEYTREEDQPRDHCSMYRGVTPYLCEYVGGVFFALFMGFCSLRGRFCVMWCKVAIGVLFGVFGKLLGHFIGRVLYKRFEGDVHGESYTSVKQDPVS